MPSRRLPGSRDPNRPPGERPSVPPPPAASLYDGELPPARTVWERQEAIEAAQEAEAAATSTFFGPRMILSTALLAHIGLAMVLVPRMIRALDRIFLSSGHLALRPMQLVPVVALGALAFGVFLWAWTFRARGWSFAFCLLSAVWWVALCVVIF